MIFSFDLKKEETTSHAQNLKGPYGPFPSLDGNRNSHTNDQENVPPLKTGLYLIDFTDFFEEKGIVIEYFPGGEKPLPLGLGSNYLQVKLLSERPGRIKRIGRNEQAKIAILGDD